MRLGINTLFLVPGDVGGTETYLRETLRVSITQYSNVEFILFTNLENDRIFRELFAGKSNVECVCLNFKAKNRPLRILLEQVRLPFVARRYNLDILWSPGYTAPFISFCRQVVTVCDLQYKSYPDDMKWLERVTLNFLVKGACRRCDAVIAISEFSRQEIVRYGFAPRENVHPVLLGVDKTFKNKKAIGERHKVLGSLIPVETPYILCVAHTYPHKKVHVLIEAFYEVVNDIPHNLVIVGKPRRGESDVERSLKMSKDTSRVFRFKDGLPFTTLQMLYQTADIFVLPSAYEGFGLPVIEAMMAGVPVITTQAASLKEVAGEHAFRMKKIDKMSLAEQLLAVASLSEEEKKIITEKAKSWAETFTWQRSAHQMFALFHSLVNGNNE